MKKFGSPKSPLFLIPVLFSGAAFAQAAPWFDDIPLPADQPPPIVTQETAVMAPSAPSTLTIPAGTRVMMVLKSPLHTTSGTAGSGIYLETLYPVIQGNQVVIPVRTQVQGMVETNRRPGHVDRASEFRFRFTSLIFANNYVAPIQGALQSVPGAKNIRTHDKDGTLKPVDQAEKVITPAAAGAVGGALLGAHRGFGVGLLPGAGLGAALGLGSVLLKRGDEISLRPGTQVEMILQAPLTLEQAQVTANARYAVQSHPAYAPAANRAVQPCCSAYRQQWQYIPEN